MNAVPDPDSAIARLASSRNQMRSIMWESHESEQLSDDFPRSKTMRLFTSKEGAIALAAIAGGLFLLKPRLLTYAIRYIPMKMVMGALAQKLWARGD